MPNVGDFAKYLEEFAPLNLSEDWDNTGLLIGRRDVKVQRAITCLTLTADVVDEAIDSECQLVVTHHPILFRPTQNITDQSVEGRLLLGLIENGIAVYSPHTSLDSAGKGVNQRLAMEFGLKRICPLRPPAEGQSNGSGRCGTLTPSTTLQKFLKTVSAVTNANYCEYVGELESRVSRVAVACGSAASFLKDAVAADCDTFVTGEASFHGALEARTAGINLILTGHYSSERPAIEELAAILKKKFTRVKVWASQVEADPLQLFTAES